MVMAACLIITQPACLAVLGLVLIIVVMSPSCLVADGACRSQLLQLTVTSTNLVDPASSHMLVSKIKPCMSQYKILYGGWLIKTIIVYLMVIHYMENFCSSKANTCAQPRLRGRVVFIRYRTNPGSAWSCGDS